MSQRLSQRPQNSLYRLGAALLFVGILAGCGNIPSSGPSKMVLTRNADLPEGGMIVPLDRRVAQINKPPYNFTFSHTFKQIKTINADVIQPGDMLSLVVYENVRDEPLLGNTGQRVSPIEHISVGRNGHIFVPYIGSIPAAGKTLDTLRQEIKATLSAQTPDPQVVLRREAVTAATVAILGLVGVPGVYPIDANTATLSAMIARAGGTPTVPADVALVSVTRGKSRQSILLSELYAKPDEDIALRPGDRVVIDRDRRKFTVLGATGGQGRIPFETQNVTILEALARVGGLSTNIADPTGIFIFRNEPAHVANAVLNRQDLVGDQRLIYAIDLTKPGAIFDAQAFYMKDLDVVWVTEAPFVQSQKALTVITGALNGVGTSANAFNGIVGQ